MEPTTDTYLSAASSSTGLYKEKGSRFISILLPVESSEHARTEIGRLRKEYHDARHCCYAYRIGLKGDIWRMNDDGEPSSTAGKSIFGQLLSNSLSDVLIVVIRYFGGIKLGVPGLINAYRSAAAAAIANALIIQKTAAEDVTLNFEYPVMNDIMKVIKEFNPPVLKQEFGLECSMTVKVRLSDIGQFRDRISKGGGKCV